jgi:hypothetical protein
VMGKGRKSTRSGLWSDAEVIYCARLLNEQLG